MSDFLYNALRAFFLGYRFLELLIKQKLFADFL